MPDSNYRCIYCGHKYLIEDIKHDKYGRPLPFMCPYDWKCRQYGDSVYPYTDSTSINSTLISSTVYGYSKQKEDNMCKEEKRWNVVIEPYSGGTGYYVGFKHVDKSTRDELSRVLDTFESALEFASKTYKELK